MAWDYFREGQRIGRVKILERLSSSNNKDHVKYAVACCGCGALAEMSHAYIMRRETEKRTSCPACAQEPKEPDSIAALAADRERPLRERYPDPSGVRDGRGQLWPRLKGPMGPRWGIGNGTNQAIGRGRDAYA